MDNDTPAGTTIDGMVLVYSYWAHTLFDTGASHSLISILFASMLGLEHEPLDSTLSMGYHWAEIVSCLIAIVQCALRLIDNGF